MRKVLLATTALVAMSVTAAQLTFQFLVALKFSMTQQIVATAPQLTVISQLQVVL